MEDKRDKPITEMEKKELVEQLIKRMNVGERIAVHITSLAVVLIKIYVVSLFLRGMMC